MRRNRLWCLYNHVTGVRLEGLRVEEVRVAAVMVPIDERLNWLVWREDWQDWLPMTTVPDLLVPVKRPLSVAPPPDYTEEDIAEETVTMTMTEGGIEAPVAPREFISRAHHRVLREFDVEIEVQGRKFSTSTVDISVGGIRLKDPLPEWVAGYCTVHLKDKRGRHKPLVLTCAIVENQIPDRRYRIEIAEDKESHEVKLLRSWLRSA